MKERVINKMAKEKVEENKINHVVGKININDIVKKAQAAYGKKETHLSSRISTGATIQKPTEDRHFVIWQGAGNHWEALTGLRGLPYGKCCQISGKPDSGKSSHAAAFMKYAQDQNVVVVLWDSEMKFSAKRFDGKIGGDSSKLITINDNTISRGAIAVANIVHAVKEQDPNQKILLVWDSVGGTLNSSEDREDSADSSDESFSKQPGVSAKENSWAIHKFMKLNSKYQNRETGEDTIAILLINQTYANIGSVGQVERGGSSIAYLSSLIVQLSRKGNLTRTKNGEKYKYGITTRARVVKNHLHDGDESIAEMDLVVSAGGVQLAKEVKSFKDIDGWGTSNSNDEDEDQFTDAADEGDE